MPRPQRKTAARIEAATRDLLSGNSSSVAVSLVAAREGVSRRQAQRVVHAAYRVLTSDLEAAEVERRELLAQLISNTQSVIAQSLATNNAGAAIAGIRCLAELVGISTPQRRL